jgi:hypothetical protein
MAHKRIVRPPEGTQAPAKSKYSELANINKKINTGLNSAPGTFLKSLLGSPISKDVLNITHFVDVGPFKVEGLDVATNSLRGIMSVVKNKYPDLYSRLSHQGMRVVKSIGGTKSTSLHSWGVAIDIKVDGVKDVRFNDKALYGLTLIAPIFHEYGWYWGGAFNDKETSKKSGVYWSNEDAMHFEVSKNALLAWDKAGLLKKKGVFSVGVFAVQKQKPSPNPTGQKPLPNGHMIIKPLPRRRGEPWLGWFCRTVSTRVKHPASWFH